MILVTGGAGFIGSHIARGLMAAGESVRVLDNLSTGKRANLDGLDVELIVGDVRDQATVRAAVRGARAVYHEAAMVSVVQTVEDPHGGHDANVNGTLNVLEAARLEGVSRVIFASSAAIYGDEPSLPKSETSPVAPRSPYAVHKLFGEHYLRLYHELYGLDTISLRYFNVFGPRQDPRSQYAAAIPIFTEHLTRGTRPTIFGDGRQTRDFVYIDDVVTANLRALAVPDPAGRVFNIAGGRETDLLELLDHLADACGHRPEPIFAAPRPGDVRRSVAAIDAAARALDFHPTVPLREGLQRTVRWMRAEG